MEGRDRGEQRDHPGHVGQELRKGEGTRLLDRLFVPGPDPLGPARGPAPIHEGQVVEDRVGGRGVGGLSQPGRTEGIAECQTVWTQRIRGSETVHSEGVRRLLRAPGRGRGEACEDRQEHAHASAGPGAGPGVNAERLVHGQPARLLTQSTKRRTGNPYPPFRW